MKLPESFNPTKTVSLLFTIGVILVSWVMLFLQSDGLAGFDFMFLLILFPHFFTIACALFFKRTASLATLMIASAASFVYFVHCYLDAFFINIDAQSGIMVGLSAFPALIFMIPLWIIAFIQEDRISKYERLELERQDENLPDFKSLSTLTTHTDQ